MLPAEAVVVGATFTGTFWFVTGLKIITVGEFPDPLFPYESENDTVKVQPAVVPDEVET